jgi:type VI secretion system secreted protein VgrG
VVVQFLDGDPDRPLIVGSVYNAAQMPPYELPTHKTRSGIKTNSTPGGAGFNEIRFEDKKGQEQVFLHAQRNQDTRVKNDQLEWVGHDHHATVVGEERESVGTDAHRAVGGELVETVGKNHTEVVTDQFWLDAGRIYIHAAREIRLVVGGNYLSISPAGISIEGTMVDINCGSAPGSCESPPGGAPKPPRPADDAVTGAASAPQ